MSIFFTKNKLAIIKAVPIKRPGTIPATNILPIETPAIAPYTTKGILGGIITPMAPDVAIKADGIPFP